MSDPLLTQEQLLSAFVDGELTGAERAQAEALLEDSRCRQLAQQWREQGTAIRVLPRYELDDNFSARVLAKLSEGRSTELNSPSNHLLQWQIGFAAIVALAALLLLTLFVFPNVGQRAAVASKVSNGSTEFDMKFKANDDDRVAKTAEPPQPTQFKGEASENQPHQDVLPMIMSGTAAEVSPKTAESDFGLATPALATDQVMSRSAKEYTSPSQPIAPGNNLAEADPRGLARSTKNEALFPGLKSEADGKLMAEPVAELDAEIDRLNRASVPVEQSTELASKIKPESLQQVFFIEFDAVNQPLEVVEQVFARNQIQILNSASAASPLDNANDSPENYLAMKFGKESNNLAQQPRGDFSDRQAASNNQTTDKLLTNQSQVGMEAVYVVSKRSQMKQAIIELSSQANISGYQMPLEASAVAPNVASQSEIADELTANLKPQSAERADSPAANSMKKMIEAEHQKFDAQMTDNKFRDAGQRQSSLSSRELAASAQQLRPYELGNQLNRGANFAAKQNYSISPDDPLVELKQNSDSEIAPSVVQDTPLADQAERADQANQADSIELQASAGGMGGRGVGGPEMVRDEAASKALENQQWLVQQQQEIEQLFVAENSSTAVADELVRYLLLVRTTDRSAPKNSTSSESAAPSPAPSETDTPNR